MKKRINLQKRLLQIGEKHGLKIYYQPPLNIQMSYPCIVYTAVDGYEKRADNRIYFGTVRYQLTLITKDPDPEAFSTILEEIPYASFRNKTTSENLHNFVFYCYE